MPQSCVCLACILCETVLQDQQTKNKSLINMFNHVMIGQFPAQMYRLSVLVSITDGRGESEGRLEIDDPDDEPVIQAVTRIQFHDPTVIYDLCFEFRDVVFRKAGRYSVNFRLGDELVVMRPFQVKAQANPS